MSNRWRREGRLEEVAAFRETIRLECKNRGLKKQEANDAAWAEAERNFPPLASAPDPESPVDDDSDDAGEFDAVSHDAGTVQPAPRGRVAGLERVPESWPALPASATLSAELSWVQSNRLWIVSESANSMRVDLSRAAEPAPSRSALAWLETSIRNYAKFTDVLAKTASTAIDENEDIRRERVQLHEIELLLGQMADV
jgi:hypothetical protein